MDDPHQTAAAASVPDLKLAIRRARIDVARHAEAIAELRGAEAAHLDRLADALKPVLAQVPPHVDLFDVGLAPGEKPRFFIDMLGFVEMARDQRVFRFLQDTRHGRVALMESEHLDAVVEAVTAYIARRLVEREQALASDQTIEQAARAYAARSQTPGEATGVEADRPQPAVVEPPKPRRRRWFVAAIRFIAELLGWIVLATALVVAALLWRSGASPWR